MPTRYLARWLACVLLVLVTASCRQVIRPRPPDPLPFPPDPPFDVVVTLHDGLVLRGSSELISQNPTTLRVTATVTNPTSEEIVARVLLDECLMQVGAFWADDPGGRFLQPLDGMVPLGPGGNLDDCENFQGFLPVPAGESIDLTRNEDLVVSEILGAEFVPGRHIVTVVFIDLFLYQALAADLNVDS